MNAREYNEAHHGKIREASYRSLWFWVRANHSASRFFRDRGHWLFRALDLSSCRQARCPFQPYMR